MRKQNRALLHGLLAAVLLTGAALLPGCNEFSQFGTVNEVFFIAHIADPHPVWVYQTIDEAAVPLEIPGLENQKAYDMVAARLGDASFDPILYLAGRDVQKVWVVQVYDSAASLQATVSVAGGPTAIAISGDGANVYTANTDDTVSAISTGTNTVVGTIPLPPGSRPTSLVVTPDSKKIYVTGRGLNKVYIIDAATRQIKGSVDAGNSPYRLAITPDGSQVWTTNMAGGSISVIDVQTDQVAYTLTGLTSPFAIGFSMGGDIAYTTSGGGNFSGLQEFDVAKGEKSGSPVATGNDPRGVAASDNSIVVTSNLGTGNITVFDDSDDSSAPITVKVGASPITVVFAQGLRGWTEPPSPASSTSGATPGTEPATDRQGAPKQ